MKTDANMRGKKVRAQWGAQIITATIEGLDPIYPDTAYTITWTRKDNPDYRPWNTNKSEQWGSQMHFSQIINQGVIAP